MTVNKSVEIITKVITNALEEYNQSPDSKTIDANGVETVLPHPLDIIDESDKLFALDMAIKDVALKASPISLLETTGSTASELRRVSTDYYIRVPTEPILGAILDIDDGLSYAVVYKALASIWREFGDYEQKADSIVNTYIQAYRVYLADLITGTVGVGAETYVRFSDDATNWHSSFALGDIYISFKKIDTDTWTTAIKFVGTDGVNGSNGTNGTNGTNFDDALSYTGNAGKVVAVNATEDGVELITPTSGTAGATTFLELSDTPIAYVAGQIVAVNATGDALELVAPTTGGGLAGANVFGDKMLFDDTASGTVTLDTQANNIFYITPTADTVIGFTPFTDAGGYTVSALEGTTYTFMLVSTSTIAMTFDANESIIGDKTVTLGTASTATATTMTMLKMWYSGLDWFVVSRAEFIDANG
jgi:hypothetical protein